MARYLNCPMCAFGFEPQDTLCAHGCPMGAACELIRCPSCGYEFPETPRSISWLRRVLGKNRQRAPVVEEGMRTVRQLKSGEHGTVFALVGAKTSRHNQLAVFGVVPGAELTVIQQYPSCVVRVGETELALDSDIAREILIEPAGIPVGGQATEPD